MKSGSLRGPATYVRFSSRISFGITKARSPIEQANPANANVQKRNGCALEDKWPSQCPLNWPAATWSKSIINAAIPARHRNRWYAIDSSCGTPGHANRGRGGLSPPALAETSLLASSLSADINNLHHHPELARPSSADDACAINTIVRLIIGCPIAFRV